MYTAASYLIAQWLATVLKQFGSCCAVRCWFPVEVNKKAGVSIAWSKYGGPKRAWLAWITHICVYICSMYIIFIYLLYIYKPKPNHLYMVWFLAMLVCGALLLLSRRYLVSSV